MMTTYTSDNGEKTFKDRSLRLILAGLLQGIVGLGCLFLFLIILLGTILTAMMDETSSSRNAGLLSAALYIFAASWFISLAWGSFSARRWARTLSLATAWNWLLHGAIGFVSNVVFIPDMYRHMGEAMEMPEEFIRMLSVGVLSFIAVFSILLPGVLVLLYSGRHVKATCERRNPGPSWADKMPVPLLMLIMIYILWGLIPTATLLILGAVPFFGVFLHGLVALLLTLLCAALTLYLAWGFVKEKELAWWCALVMFVLGPVSYGLSFLLIDLKTLYERLGISVEEMSAMGLDKIEMSGNPLMIASTLIWWAILLGLLLFAKRYFAPAQHGEVPKEAGF